MQTRKTRRKRKPIAALLGIGMLMGFVAYTAKIPVPVTMEIDMQTETVDAETVNLESVCLHVPICCQFPSLPTGCEATAAAMVLQYWGEEVTPEEVAENWLPASENFYTLDGVDYGPDPRKEFVGNPFTTDSYGCYAPVIVDAINKNSTRCQAENYTGASLTELFDCISQGTPVLIWATVEMKPARVGNSWVLESGETFTWTAGEHCLVLVGYEDGMVYLNDPYTGRQECYDIEIVEERYEELGCQAVLIYATV